MEEDRHQEELVKFNPAKRVTSYKKIDANQSL